VYPFTITVVYNTHIHTHNNHSNSPITTTTTAGRCLPSPSALTRKAARVTHMRSIIITKKNLTENWSGMPPQSDAPRRRVCFPSTSIHKRLPAIYKYLPWGICKTSSHYTSTNMQHFVELTGWLFVIVIRPLHMPPICAAPVYTTLMSP
jgi:hypothetical protein